MKKVIVNNEEIRLTANGHSIVEGSFARVTEIRGKTIDYNGTLEHSSIKGIYSHNRNLLSKENSISLSKWTNDAYSSILPKLINKQNVTHLSLSSTLISNGVFWQARNNPRLTLKYRYIGEDSYRSSAKKYDFVYNGIKQERSATFQLPKDTLINSIVCCFNDFSSAPIGLEFDDEGLCVSIQNQLEIGTSHTRYVESESYEYSLPQEITLRSTLDNSLCDVYYPEQGKILRVVDSSCAALNTPYFEDAPQQIIRYKVFNNGYEKLLTTITGTTTVYDYGAIPELVVEYEIEEKQGADRTRFDFITLDGEAICGIGYEKLKSTNQLQYVEEPSRQNDGSMQNIEDYETFVLPALEVGFNCINEETYRRLKHKLISKRTFDVGYYDKDLDKVVTMEMYVKPIDLDNFLSRGDEIIGMNSTLSFISALNEESKYTVEFFNADMTRNTIFDGDKGVMYGRSIETPTLPSGYNYWLMIDSGFKENTYVKIKGKKKLAIFGNTKLIAVK